MSEDQPKLPGEPSQEQYVLVPVSQLNALNHQASQPEANGLIERLDAKSNSISLISYVLSYKWLVLTVGVLAIIAGAIYTFLQTPVYRATAQLEFFVGAPEVYEDFEVISRFDDYVAFENAIIKFRSRRLALRVVEALDLANRSDFLQPQSTSVLGDLVERLTGGRSAVSADDWPLQQRQAVAVGRVLGGLSAGSLPNSSIMTVSFSHESPEYAALVANQAAQSFIDQSVDNRGEISSVAVRFLEERVADTKRKLQSSEKMLLDYARQQDLTLSGEGAYPLADNISRLNAALSTAIEDRLTAERFQKQVSNGQAAALPAVADNEFIATARSRIAELSALYEEKQTSLKPEFPEMRGIKAQIDELGNQIEKTVQGIADGVDIELQQAVARESDIRRELLAMEEQRREFLNKNIHYRILKREVESNRAQYDYLINELNRADLGSTLKHSNASIIDFAGRPGFPFTPRLERNILMSLAMAAALCAVLIYLNEQFRGNIATPEQVTSDLNLPVMGMIPWARGDTLDTQLSDARSRLSEAYRSLRTSVQFAGTESGVKTLLVTSSMSMEGKSTTASKLAQDFGALGRRVLLIDADMRRPSQHRLYKSPRGPGLSNLLSNVIPESGFLQFFYKTRHANVTLLPAGDLPPNPADLLASPRMQGMLRGCERHFDLIVIDSPPVADLADSAVLAQHTDVTLLVVSSQGVPRRAVKGAVARLEAVKANIVGAVLTKVRLDRPEYGYGYAYRDYGHDAPEDGVSDTRLPRPVAQAHNRVSRLHAALSQAVRGKVRTASGSPMRGQADAESATDPAGSYPEAESGVANVRQSRNELAV